jgi:anaerobic selenocysteine-containing dehydrogenase
MSQTGANADEWVPVKPGTEGVLALGLAHVIMAATLRPAGAAGRAGALIDGWSSGLTGYTPDAVEKRTGVPAARVERLAKEFAADGPAVALVGGPPLGHTNGLFHALAVNALNELVGSVGEAGGVTFMPQVQLTAGAAAARRSAERPQPVASFEKFCANILATERSPVQLLLVDGSNPVFATPPAWRVREALQKIPFIASFGNFTDETSVLADLILPDHSFLESWVDGLPEAGASVAVANLAPPAMRPLHQTRAMPDVLLDVARRLRQPLQPQLPETFEEVLKAAFDALPAPSGSEAQSADDAWTVVQERGGWWGATPGAADAPGRQAASPAMDFVEPQFDGDAAKHPFHFLPYVSQAFLDGSLAHLPWLQEMPDSLSTAMWSSWVEINPRLAERLGIHTGDLVEIASRHGTLRAAALLSPGLAPDVIAMPVGQGHQTFTRYASGRGENPISLLGPIAEASTGSLAWAATRVALSRVDDGDGRLILFAGETREHPHGRER